MLLGKRFRSLVVNTNEDDVEGDEGDHLHHASHPSHSSHAPHAAHATGHASCSTLGLLRDLGDDTLQQSSILAQTQRKASENTSAVHNRDATPAASVSAVLTTFKDILVHST